MIGRTVQNDADTPLLAWWDRPMVITNAWMRTEIQSAKAIADLVLSDSDQDGDLDILASRWHGSEGEVLFFENDGTASFTERSLGGNYAILRASEVGDLDLDGDDDFITAGGDSDVVDWIENRTIRSTVGFTGGSANGFQGSGPTPLAFGLVDLDRDGDLDMVSYDRCSSSFRFQTARSGSRPRSEEACRRPTCGSGLSWKPTPPIP